MRSFEIEFIKEKLETGNGHDFPSATFSRFSSKLGTIEPEEEVKWVHDTLAMRR